MHHRAVIKVMVMMVSIYKDKIRAEAERPPKPRIVIGVWVTVVVAIGILHQLPCAVVLLACNTGDRLHLSANLSLCRHFLANCFTGRRRII